MQVTMESLQKERQKLWIKWLHNYYYKDKFSWSLEVKNTSWVIRKILKAKVHMENAGNQNQDLVQMEKFSIKNMYVH